MPTANRRVQFKPAASAMVLKLIIIIHLVFIWGHPTPARADNSNGMHPGRQSANPDKMPKTEIGYFTGEKITMELTKAVEIALKNRYELAVADLTTRQAESVLKAAKAGRYPTVSALASSRYTETIDDFEPVEFSFEVLNTSFTI